MLTNVDEGPQMLTLISSKNNLDFDDNKHIIGSDDILLIPI